MTSTSPTRKTDTISVERCHDAALIEKILHEDYFDAPIPQFTAGLRKRAARELLAPSPQVYFMLLKVDGTYAGFVFAHSLGKHVWREFARHQLWKNPIAVAWVVLKLKLINPLREKWLRRVPDKQGLTDNLSEKIAALKITPLGHPFDWTHESAVSGQVDLLFVHPSFRGMGLAPHLLQETVREMQRAGLQRIEAHVDSTNYASLKAFLKAGWESFQATGGDFLVRTP